MMESYTAMEFYVLDGFTHLKVLELCHDTYMVGHFKIRKTLEFGTQSFWWP